MVAAMGSLLTTAVTAFVGRRLRQDVQKVHSVVNSRFTAALERIGALEKEIRSLKAEGPKP